MNSPVKFQERISRILRKNLVDIKINKKDPKRVPHEKDFGQGDLMSSILFNLAMLPLILALNNYNKQNGYKITHIKHPTGPNIKPTHKEAEGKIINYADDNNSILVSIEQVSNILKI